MKISIGIDTSNYKTSVAAVNSNGEILFDERIPLEVKPGGLGLRQQEAVFQHINNLPILISGCLDSIDGEVDIVSASSAPRKMEGSYMPCFIPGVSFGKVLSKSLGADFKTFSHQEGHIEAGCFGTPLTKGEPFIAFHFSGGTTEALLRNSDSIEIIGGTKDISYGQLIDRIGQKLELKFPSGEEMDRLALKYIDPISKDEFKEKTKIGKIKVKAPYINLSGIETEVLRLIDDDKELYLTNEGRSEISYTLFDRISESIIRLIEVLVQNNYPKDFLLVGGVSSSRFIRERLEALNNDDVRIYFAREDLSPDNAVGIALLGGLEAWHQ